MNNPDTPVHMQQPELPEPDEAGKLVLPPPVNEYSPLAGEQKTVARPLPPLPPYRPPAPAQGGQPPSEPLAKVSYYWRKDPAYKVFIIATCMVVIAGIVFVSLAAAAVTRNPNLFSMGTNGSTAQSGPTPTSTVDLRPVFPTPGGGSGSTQSSQPPVTSTPALPSTPVTTPTTQPTQPPNNGTLTAQITSIPSQVFNGQTVQVVVTTNTPGATVRIEVLYNTLPYYYASGSQQADGSGNAIVFWRVGVSGFAHGHIIARVTAFATANGQRVASQSVSVQVMNGSVP